MSVDPIGNAKHAFKLILEAIENPVSGTRFENSTEHVVKLIRIPGPGGVSSLMFSALFTFSIYDTYFKEGELQIRDEREDLLGFAELNRRDKEVWVQIGSLPEHDPLHLTIVGLDYLKS